MPPKFYVVWKGHNPGIYTDWPTCQKQVGGFAGARYKSFKSRAEAEAAYAGGPQSAAAKKGGSKSSGGGGKSGGGGRGGHGLKTHTQADIDAVEAPVKIFTDGGCEPNPGEAASGLAVYRDSVLVELWYGLYTPRGTNNTAELGALHQALIMAERELAAGAPVVAVFSDSSYAIQCITQWAFGWAKRGWKKKDGEIKNLELIQSMFALFTQLRGKVQVLHVNGHVGVEGNELADRMSIHGIEQKQAELAPFPVPDDLAEVMGMRRG